MPKLYVVANAIGYPGLITTNYGHLQIVHGSGTTWDNSTLTEVEVQRPQGSDYWDYGKFNEPFETNNMKYQYIELRLVRTQTVEYVWLLIEQIYYSLKVNGANLDYYALSQNSNSFIKTMLYVIGNDENWSSKFSDQNINSFPGWDRNVLFGAYVDEVWINSIALNLAGTAGNDIIRTGNGNDSLGGAAGNDMIFSYVGNDSLFGGDGIDTLYGGHGYDSIFGGADNDHIYGGNDSDTIQGDTGNDIIYGEIGHEYIYGGDGKDTLFGGDGIDFLYGGANDDRIYGGNDNDVVYGDAGSDISFGDLGDDLLFGGDGNDTFYCGDGFDFIFGGADNDRIYGGNGNDTMYGDAGSDMIYGDLGDEFIFGGDGQDSIYGGAGKEFIFGGADRDSIYGGDGIGIIYGDSGADRIYGGANFDLIYGGTDDDSIYGGNFRDSLYGGSGNDFIYAGEGLDLIFGGSGNDVIYGGVEGVFVPTNASTMNAQYIYGGSGKDTIYASDVMDIIIFNSMPNSNEVDTIYNFSPNSVNGANKDVIYLNKLYFAFSWSDLISENDGSWEWYVETNRTGSATHVNHRIICDSDDGRVYFDPDGTGAAAAQHFLNLKYLNLPSDLQYLDQASFYFMEPTYSFMFEP